MRGTDETAGTRALTGRESETQALTLDGWYALLKADVARVILRPPRRRDMLRVLVDPKLEAAALYRLGHALHIGHHPVAAQACHALSIMILGCDIHPEAEIAAGLLIGHPVGIVIGRRARIERDVTIMQGVTIGRTAHYAPEMPTIGRGAMVSTHATILGAVTVGEDAIVGAGALVLSDVPPRAKAVATMAKILEADGPHPGDHDAGLRVGGEASPEALRGELEAAVARITALERHVAAAQPERSRHAPDQDPIL